MEKERHHGILKEKRVYLVGHLALKDTLVLDQLVQDGVLSSDQLKGMKERCPTNTELASDLVRHLERRPLEDWEKFLRCLSDQNQGHIVSHVSSTLNVYHCCPGISDLRCLLVAIILENLDNIPLWTLHSDRVSLPMDDIYVNLVLVKDRQRQDREDEPLRSYKEIFKKIKGRGTVYLTGEPGVGKSTLSKRMCVDWANFLETKVRPAECDKFEQYEFVLLVFLRDVRTDQTFCQVIARAYQLREHEAESLCRYIETTQMPVLIILDGIDEYKEETSREITELIHRERYPHVTVFITSRLPSESVYADDTRVKCTEVRLEGFSDVGVQEYVRKYYDKKREEGQALLKEIQKSEEMVHLSHYPAILLMMATLWSSTHKLASTVTGFYKEFVAYVFGRMEKKLKIKMANRAKSTDDLFERYCKQIMDLGHLASGNVKTHRLELIFPQEDVLAHIGCDDLNTGFLVGKHTFSREMFYLFIHKTVQEFFLSFFLVHSDESKQKELLMRFFNSRKAFAESAMIRRFVAGLGGEGMQRQIETLLDGNEVEVAEMHTALQLDYLAEHQEAQVILPKGVRLEITDRYPGTHYVRYLSQDGGALEKIWLNTCNEKHWRLVQYVHAPNLISLSLSFSASIGRCSIENELLKQSLDVTVIKFNLKQLTARTIRGIDEASAVVNAIIQIPTLQFINLTSVPLTEDLAQTLISWLSKSHIQSLTISSCKLGLQEVTAMFRVLPSSIHTLNVNGNNLHGLQHSSQMLSFITRLPLQSLSMSLCKLSPQGVLAVIDAIPETLTDLNLSANCWKRDGDLCDDLGNINNKTDKLSKLTKLDLSKNSISGEVVEIIRQKLAETCPDLKLIHGQFKLGDTEKRTQ